MSFRTWDTIDNALRRQLRQQLRLWYLHHAGTYTMTSTQRDDLVWEIERNFDALNYLRHAWGQRPQTATELFGVSMPEEANAWSKR